MKKIIVTITLILFGFSVHSQELQGYDIVKITVQDISSKNDLTTIKNFLFDQDGILDVAYSSIQDDKVEFTIKYYRATVDEQKLIQHIEEISDAKTASGKAYKVHRIDG